MEKEKNLDITNLNGMSSDDDQRNREQHYQHEQRKLG